MENNIPKRKYELTIHISTNNKEDIYKKISEFLGDMDTFKHSAHLGHSFDKTEYAFDLQENLNIDENIYNQMTENYCNTDLRNIVCCPHCVQLFNKKD